MDRFRVIRDFADYTNAQYGYDPTTNQVAAAGNRSVIGGAIAPWHEIGRIVAEHEYKNPYGQFGGQTGSKEAPEGNQRGRFGQGKFQQKQQSSKKKVVRRQHTQYPYTPVPESMSQKAIPTSNGAFCFHGYQSIFTLQHRFDFIIDGTTFKSVDQYYQLQKVKDLTGITSAKFTDGSTRDYSSLARDLLRQASLQRHDVDNWRTSKGVVVIQKALLEKVRQCFDLRSAITSTGDKIIVQSFAGDDFYGAGTPAKYVKDWLSGLEKNKVSLKFPMEFPLDQETVKYVPVIGKGKNVLGAIYMILREKINNGQLESLSVNIEGKKTATASTTEPMNVDFTADSNS